MTNSTLIEASVERRSLGRMLLSGSSALGAATLLERGLGFAANLAAARLGGAQVYGAYSVAMTTANNVASYAGAGIGTTANRFSGECPYGKPGYAALLNSLAIVSLGSAALAGVVLWISAAPLANHLLRNPELTSLLEWAAISSAVIILLECTRGLFIGQRRFQALMTLCGISGIGMAVLIPAAAATGGPVLMVKMQAVAAAAAIAFCILLARRLKFAPVGPQIKEAGPRPAAIVRFGLIQLAAVVGINASGWWIASLVARSDVSLIQMGWYSVAMQIRNICAMPPSLVSQTAYAQMTEQGGSEYGGAARVTLVSTFAATAVSLLISGTAAALMPWAISHTYGSAFSGGELAATLAVATGLVHMSAAPAAARLTIVSLRLTGFINGIWAVFVAVAGGLAISIGGATAAVAVLLAAHILSAVLVLISLIKLRAVSCDLAWSTAPSIIGALSIAVLAWMRSLRTDKIPLSFALLPIAIALILVSYLIARRAGALQPQDWIS